MRHRPPRHLELAAYRLAAERADLFDQIGENVLVTLTPTDEPDGRDRYVDWYYRHLIDITGGMGLEGVLELQRFVDEGELLHHNDLGIDE